MDSEIAETARTSAADGIAALGERAGRTIAAGADGYWLLDPSRYGSVGAAAAAFGLTPDEFDQLPNLYEHYTPELRQWGPRLLRANLGDRHWTLAEHEATAQRSTSLLLASVPAAQLVAHLKTLIKLPQPDGSRLLFRFQDPIVLTNVIPLLARMQTLALLGPALCWMALDVCGGLVDAVRPAHTSVTPRALALTGPQMTQLDERLLPATVIAQANEVDTTLLGQRDACGQWCLVRERIEIGRRHGLRVPGDLSLYVVLGLQLPEDFDRVGPVAEALRRAVTTGIGFRKAVEDVPVSEWRKWDEMLDAR